MPSTGMRDMLSGMCLSLLLDLQLIRVSVGGFPKDSPGASIVVQDQSNKRKLDEGFNSDNSFASQPNQKRVRSNPWRDNPVQGTPATCPSQGESTYGMYPVVLSNPCSVQAIGVHRPTSKISAAYSPDTTRVYEDPYLRFELQGQEHRDIPFDLFLQAVFPETRTKRLEHMCSEISTSGEIQQSLQAYLETVHRPGTKEEDLYHPFSTLVSSIITAAGVSDFRYISIPEHYPRGAVDESERK